MKALAIPLGVIGAIALLGVIGVLGSLGTLFASEQQAAQAGRERTGAPDWRSQAAGLHRARRARRSGGSWQGGCGGSRRSGRSPRWWWPTSGAWTAGSSTTSAPASELFADDPITTRLKREPKPYRVLDAGVYQGSVLMAHRMQSVLGYHGNEIRFYDDLMGGKNSGATSASPNLHDLLAVRYPACCRTRRRCRASAGHGADPDDARIGRRAL